MQISEHNEAVISELPAAVAVPHRQPLTSANFGGSAALSRAIPFAVFMSFIGADELLRFLSAAGLYPLRPESLYYLYPAKVAAAALLLYRYRHRYLEFNFRELAVGKRWIAVTAVGLVTCVLWVSMEWTLPLGQAPAGFNPTLLPEGPVRLLMTLARLAGAVLVVPLMEELFWRSFLLRYLIDPDFESVPMGKFTWTSFLVAAVLFGLEHHFVWAGVAAGMIYSLVLYKTRSIAHCVLAHAVTNLALACYVLYTGKWYFW